MTFTPTFKNTDTRWGAGTGAGVAGRLTSLQADENIFGFLEWLTELAAEGPLQIEDITFAGNAITIEMSDNTTRGPFLIPVAMLNPRGFWQNDQTLFYLDLVNVRGNGLYLVLVDHITPSSPAAFDPDATDDSTDNNLLYKLWAPIADYNYDVAISLPGVVPDGAVSLAQLVFSREILMPADLPFAQAYLAIAAQNTAVVITIEKNGNEIGTITFTPGVGVNTDGSQTSGVIFPAAVSFEAGDVLVLRAPIISDTAGTDGLQASDLSITLPAIRQDI